MPDDPRVKTVRVLDSYDFDSIIEEHFGRPWCAQQSTYQAQGSTVRCVISGPDECEPYYTPGVLAKIALWVASPSAGEWVGRTSHEEVHMEFDEFLDALCANGVLEPGAISLHFCW